MKSLLDIYDVGDNSHFLWIVQGCYSQRILIDLCEFLVTVNTFLSMCIVLLVLCICTSVLHC